VVDDTMRGRIKLTILAANFVTPSVGRPQDNLYGSSRPLYGNPPSPPNLRRSAAAPPPAPAPAPAPSAGPQPIPGLPSVPPPPGAADHDLDMPTFVRRNLERRDPDRR
jgi:hypothetical protein